ncbi:hypothetical protein G1K46_06050 [Tenacibaculum finnmarkense]|uniref:hypothetical protein n=1 Tax=Tenacibaculum finnmarkense TaxID=2781243 RepID=UPI001EFAAA1A|nr:hypothetical protein [Tenacibaculum finnmarkense]MCG8762304.1 hypothetical protein [Tenacibaculum finnmarkense]MCG8787680.1 hypothetical protein [Tenacibaculum finnmarkense]
MKFLITIIIILIVFISCEYGVNIKINNDTSQKIDSVYITNYFKTIKIREFKTNKNYKFFIDFKNNKHKGDGVFILSLFKDNVKKHYQFGYFSNGIPPNEDINVIIKKDTILFK